MDSGCRFRFSGQPSGGCFESLLQHHSLSSGVRPSHHHCPHVPDIGDIGHPLQVGWDCVKTDEESREEQDRDGSHRTHERRNLEARQGHEEYSLDGAEDIPPNHLTLRTSPVVGEEESQRARVSLGWPRPGWPRMSPGRARSQSPEEGP